MNSAKRSAHVAICDVYYRRASYLHLRCANACALQTHKQFSKEQAFQKIDKNCPRQKTRTVFERSTAYTFQTNQITNGVVWRHVLSVPSQAAVSPLRPRRSQ